MEENLNNVNNEVNYSNKNNEEKKDNKVIICILVIFLVGALGFIGYDKFFNKETPPEPTPVPTQSPLPTDNPEVEYKEWMNYILAQDITKIEISKVPCSEDTFESKTEVINTEQLKEIFKKFMNYKLQVVYSGGGGWECGEELNIKYQKNGSEYELRYLGSEGHIIPSSDGCATIYDKDLENALYNSSDVKDEEFKNQEGICVMYAILTDDLLLDEFFK